MYKLTSTQRKVLWRLQHGTFEPDYLANPHVQRTLPDLVVRNLIKWDRMTGKISVTTTGIRVLKKHQLQKQAARQQAMGS